MSPVTLELLDRFTIGAVDDMNDLGLDREAAAMLMIESDLPGVAALAEMERAEEVCLAAGATLHGPCPATRRRPTGCARLVERPIGRSSGWATSTWRTSSCRGRACRTCSVRSRRSRSATTSASGRSVMPATATSTRTSSSNAATRRPPKSRRRCAAELYRTALDLGGSVTGEHGIGVARREWLVEQRGEDAVRVMRAIKAALDPLGILNPGRVLPDVVDR